MSGSGPGHRGTRAWRNSLLSDQHFLPPSRNSSLLRNSKQREGKKKKKKIKLREWKELKNEQIVLLSVLFWKTVQDSADVWESRGILHGAADTDCPWKTDKPRRVGGGGGTEHENVEALALMRNRRHTQWTQKTVSLAICVLQRIQMDGGEGDYAAGLLFQSLF